MEFLNNGELVSRQKERRTDLWSSLPVLLLWMVKDKLDIFDNARFAAVCRDWRSASNCYPKVLQSVGDGLPWITGSNNLRHPLEFVSTAREQKFKVDMHEYVEDTAHSILFSRKGWILLQIVRWRRDSVLFLVNPFTRARIVLPPGPIRLCRGYFNTDSDGYPNCVFLLALEVDRSVAIIKTASPGEEKWTDHTFQGRGSKFTYGRYFIKIQDCVYSLESDYGIKAFNVSDHTWKQLPHPTNTVLRRGGFIVEQEGELIFVQHVHDCKADGVAYRFSSFALYRYNVAACSWEKVSFGDVKDTTWFYDTTYGCIATKGKGLKIYTFNLKCFASKHKRWVEAYDLLTGNRETLQIPFELNCYSTRWVDIG